MEFRTPMDKEIYDQEKVLQRTKLDTVWKSGMFRPTTLRHERSPGRAAWTCFGAKYCLSLTRISSLKYVLTSVLTLGQESQIINNIPVAGDKGFLCVDFGPLPNPSSSLIVCKVCNSFKEQEYVVLPRQALVEQKNNLVHIRVMDDKVNFNVLIAGNYTSDRNPQQLIRFTEEYSSKTNRWEPAGHPNFEGSFEKDSFQNGAYLKNPMLELLFCITTLDTSMGRREKVLVKYDFKRKRWGRIDRLQIIVNDHFGPPGVLQQPSGGLQLLGVEECGGIIFLFTEQEYTNQDLCIIIHKLDIDRSGNLSWREIMRRQRQKPRNTDNTARVGFIVYPNTTLLPSHEDVDRSGGCVFAFTFTCSLERSGDYVTIHELENFNYDPESDQWSWEKVETKRFDPRVLSNPDYILKARAPNWTDDELKGFQLLQKEAGSKRLKPGFSVWNYISEGLWQLGGFDRRPKSCQEKAETLRRQPGAGAGVRKRKGVPKPPPNDMVLEHQIRGRSSLQVTCSLDNRSENTPVTGSRMSWPDTQNPVVTDSWTWSDNPTDVCGYGGPSGEYGGPSSGYGGPSGEYGGPSGDGGSFSPRTALLDSLVRQTSAANVEELPVSTPHPASMDAGTSSPAAPTLPTSNIQPLATNAHLQSDSFEDLFIRFKENLERNDIKFTKNQEAKLLIPKIDELDVLKAKVKEANVGDSKIQEPDTSKFCRVINRFQDHEYLENCDLETIVTQLEAGLNFDISEYRRMLAGAKQ